MTSFFQALKDDDFYSNKLEHIYLNSNITEETVSTLINQIKDINKSENPKPILIHISSIGGDVNNGYRFLSIFDSSKVPIATIIDNYAFSAATFLFICSPYRLMTKEAYCLLHDYSITFNEDLSLNKKELSDITAHFDKYFNNIIDIYLKKTKFKKNKLIELLQHDIYLDYKDCLSNGIVHRIINYEYKLNSPITHSNIKSLMQNPNTIELHLNPCNQYSSNIDYTIMSNNHKNTNFIIYPQYYTKLNELCSDKSIPTIFNHLNLINKVKNIKGYKIAIINNPISIDNLLPLLFTHKIYIYQHSFIICNLLYLYNLKPSILLDDIIKNNKTLFKLINHILSSKTKMNKSLINNINKQYSIISPADAIKLQLCHEIINIH
jgi:ATP-dependent protease ClpP protease subunit